MEKKETEELLNWDAHYVGISALREQKRACITLEEVVDEVMPLLSPYARTTILGQIPQFMEWGASDLKGNMAYLKSSYLSKPWS